jgi:uncharacterized RDD family membrane protein YckC
MKCHGCGHEFPNTSARCPRCHRATSRRGRTSTDSRLLEFPRRARVAAPAEASAAPLPAWRVELNEKVRAIRANRDASSATIEPPVEELVRSFDAGAQSNILSGRQDELRRAYDKDASLRATAPRTENESATPAAVSGRRSSNNIVEAALTRVKRATENASRAALPKIEPARSIQPSNPVSMIVDRQATARALDPVPEVEPAVEIVPTPRPEVVQPLIVMNAPAEATAVTEASVVAETMAEDKATPAPTLVLDEIGPLDYLEAEVRKVDKAYGAEFLRNESPSMITHAVIDIFDLMAVALSCSPFLAFVMIADGSFSIVETRLATGAMVLLIAFFYLALTQCLCGRTFGMMITNTRVVDSQAFEAPSPAQAFLRTVGYFVAAAPALVGIMWAAFDNKHRGWQDLISRTVVVRDF